MIEEEEEEKKDRESVDGSRLASHRRISQMNCETGESGQFSGNH